MKNMDVLSIDRPLCACVYTHVHACTHTVAFSEKHIQPAVKWVR